MLFEKEGNLQRKTNFDVISQRVPSKQDNDIFSYQASKLSEVNCGLKAAHGINTIAALAASESESESESESDFAISQKKNKHLSVYSAGKGYKDEQDSSVTNRFTSQTKPPGGKM